MFTMKLRGVTYKTDTLKEMSEIYCEIRDESYEGASTFPFGKVKSVSGTFTISYNGKVFNSKKELVFAS